MSSRVSLFLLASCFIPWAQGKASCTVSSLMYGDSGGLRASLKLQRRPRAFEERQPVLVRVPAGSSWGSCRELPKGYLLGQGALRNPEGGVSPGVRPGDAERRPQQNPEEVVQEPPGRTKEGTLPPPHALLLPGTERVEVGIASGGAPALDTPGTAMATLPTRQKVPEDASVLCTTKQSWAGPCPAVPTSPCGISSPAC